MTSRLLALLCIVGTTAGCPPPWQQAYTRAETSLKSGRYADAATAFGESCDADSEASDACVRAKTLRRQVVEDTLLTATGACEKDLHECLRQLGDARRFVVREPEMRAGVEALLDKASSAHIARCQKRSDGSYKEIMAKGRCITAAEADVGTGAHMARVTEALGELAALLDVDESAPPPPAEYLVKSGLAACFGPNAARSKRVSLARSAVTARHRHDVDVSRLNGVRGEVADSVCSALAQETPIRCANGSGAVKLVGSFDVGRVQHDIQRIPKSVRYVDYIEERPNPEYQSLKALVAQLEAEKRQAARDEDVAEAECNAASRAYTAAGYCSDCPEYNLKRSACDRETALERAENDAERAYNDKSSELNRTDRILEIEHYAEFDYIEQKHVWEQPARVEATCSIGPFAEPPLSAMRALRFEDIEHTGFARARLVEDPLTPPSGADFVRAGQEAARQELNGFLRRCLTSLSKDKARCDTELDCFMREELYQGHEPLGATLNAFSSLVDRDHPDLPRMQCRHL